MKSEYDFSKAERGKFHHPNARRNLPIYLDDDVRRYVTSKANDEGVEVTKIVNDLLRKDIEPIDSLE